jgi:hypothetical protein
MRHDRPTVPHAGAHEPGASTESQARDERLIWPGADEGRRRHIELKEVPSGHVSALAFGVSLGANIVLLASLVGAILLVQAGVFSSATRGRAQSSSTVTSSATSSPSPNAASLQVSPSSVQLTCVSGQRTQFVTLQNSGTAKVRWQAKFSVPTQQAGVAVSPQQGELAAGGSAPIQLQNTTRSGGSQGTSGRQGVITFAPLSSEDGQNTGADAGSSATLSYTTVGCH